MSRRTERIAQAQAAETWLDLHNLLIAVGTERTKVRQRIVTAIAMACGVPAAVVVYTWTQAPGQDASIGGGAIIAILLGLFFTVTVYTFGTLGAPSQQDVIVRGARYLHLSNLPASPTTRINALDRHIARWLRRRCPSPASLDVAHTLLTDEYPGTLGELVATSRALSA